MSHFVTPTENAFISATGAGRPRLHAPIYLLYFTLYVYCNIHVYVYVCVCVCVPTWAYVRMYIHIILECTRSCTSRSYSVCLVGLMSVKQIT